MAENSINDLRMARDRRKVLLNRLYTSTDPAEKAEIQRSLASVNQLGADLVADRREQRSLDRFGGDVEARDAAVRAEGDRITSPDYIENAIREGRAAEQRAGEDQQQRSAEQRQYISDLRRRQSADRMGVDAAGMRELESLNADVRVRPQGVPAAQSRDNPAQDMALALERNPALRASVASGPSLAQMPTDSLRAMLPDAGGAAADDEIEQARARAAMIAERRRDAADRDMGAGVLPGMPVAAESQRQDEARRQRIMANRQAVLGEVQNEADLREAAQQAAINAILPAEQQAAMQGVPAERLAQDVGAVSELVAPLRDVITADVPQRLTNSQIGQLQTTLGSVRARVNDPNLSPSQRQRFAADALAMLGGSADTVGSSVGSRVAEDATRGALGRAFPMIGGLDAVVGRGRLDGQTRRFYSDLQQILRELQQAAGQ